MMCRTYAGEGRCQGLPSRELIRQALREARAKAPIAHDCCNVAAATGSVSVPAGAKRKGLLLGASVAAAIGASLCCILPIVAAVTGAGVLAAGATFEKWRPYLLGVTGLLLAGGFLWAYRDHKKACAPGSLCATKPMSRWNFVALGIVALLVIGLAAFPYYSGTVAQAVVRQQGPMHSVGSVPLATASFKIPDMDCAACAISLSASFKQLAGVTDAKVDFASRRAIVTYDPAKQNFATFEKVVTNAGFHAQPEPRS